MDDFEYSVDISDRDWECFFAACEDLNLPPPSLAGVDDSGMSDIDDPASILAKRVQKVNLTAGFSEGDCPIDGPPDSEGSPAEHYLSKHGIGGMESILSGSEEDIDMQSVNIFFERLKNVTEAKRLTEPTKVRAGINREALEEEKRCSDGQQACSRTFPKNVPKLNLPARCETAVGKEITETVDSNINTMKKAHPESKFIIREEACTETRVNEATQRNQSHGSPDGVVCSETTLHTDRVTKVEMCTPVDDVKQEDLLTSQLLLSKKCSTDSWSNLEMVTNVKWKEDQNPNVLQSDATSTNKTASQEYSPSAAIRRKRRKKRRLSVEPAESVQGYERQVSVKQSDSEEEQYAWRGGTGLCVSEDINLCYLNEPQKHLTTNSAISKLPVKISAKEIKVNDLSHYSRPCDSQYQYLPQTTHIVTQGRCEATSSAEHNGPNDRSVTPLSQTHHDGVMSAPNNSGNVATNLQPCSKLQGGDSIRLNKYPGLPVSVTEGVTGTSDLATETANCGRKNTHAGSLQQSDKLNHPNICCKKEQNPESCTAEVKSITHGILPSAESYDPAVKVSQNYKLSAAKSVLAVEAGTSGRDNQTLCQREAEPQQQLEIGCHYTDQYSSTLEKAHFPLSATGKSSCDAYNSKPKNFNTRVCPFLEKTSSQVDCAKLGLDTSNSFSKMRCPSDITSLSSCCTLDTGSVTSLSNENVTDMSGSSCLYVSQNYSGGHGEKTSLMLAKHEEGVDTSGPKSQSVSSYSTDSKCNLVVEAEDAIAASKAECEPVSAPDSKYSVFAMSSFWCEMEKLTINDILGLRMLSKAAPPSSLPPLQESEEIDMFGMTDSGVFTQLEESKPEKTFSDPNSAKSSSDSVNAVDSSSTSGVMWESEPVPVSLGADIYPENMILTSVSEISQPVLPAQTCLRKIAKKGSVHNLHALESHALESLSYTWKGQTLQTLEQGELEKVECFTDGHMPKKDKDVECFASSSTDSYRISLRDVFQYLFGGEQSIPSHSTTDNITSGYTDGNSVPETYDDFFSEFDTESFFYPLITAEDQAKDELVPIISFSRSANRNLQFPEAYDHFFASSSDDDSSDEEDNCDPVRVVSRFSRTSSATQIFTDIYENFFSDSDLKQNLFWKNALSFRNMSFTGQKRTPSSLLSLSPVRQNGRSLRRTVHPINALGNQTTMIPDPLLHHLDDRISRQLAQQSMRYEDLQMAVSNPRLDASLLPLRQSDMCLVCIAFASWVLKTANPQVGDAWKAVLLANVSALSAIRYLRKYVKMEGAASQKRLHHSSPYDS